jgi:four helix bundle protein
MVKKIEKMSTSSYQGLIVWQKAMELTVEVYKIIKKLPKEETYSLCDQMKRSAVSIPSNIAEGHERGTNKEFIYFLTIARGSRAELETQLQICIKVGYLSEQDISVSMSLLKEIGSMLTALISKLKTEN